MGFKRFSCWTFVLFSLSISCSEASFIDSLFNLFDFDGDAELDQLLESQSKLDRQKRQEVTVMPPSTPATAGPFSFLCTTELFRKMDKCCKVPQLYPNDILNKCSGRNLLMALPKGPRKNIRPVQLRLRKNFLVSSPKNASIKSRVEDICRAHCIFKSQRWITPDNYIDDNLMFNTMYLLMPPGPYQTLMASHVRLECTGVWNFNGDFSANVTNMYGQKCLLSPFRMLRCIKRSMLLAYNTCPSQVASNQQCDLDKSYLKVCDIYGV